MKVAIMQPYFLPYIGYWQLINAVDIFVMFDDVNFIKKGYINRNVILGVDQPQRFTLELVGASQNKLINEISVGNNCQKLKKSIEISYRKAPFFNAVFPILEGIFNQDERNLAKFLAYSLEIISKYLSLDTIFIYSSKIEKDNTLRSQDKIIDICRKKNALRYINAIGGQNMYQKEMFSQHGIELNFLESEMTKYAQFKEEFIPYLSIIDILMFNDKGDVKNMLNNYSLK
jgi:hypothetical protein